MRIRRPAILEPAITTRLRLGQLAEPVADKFLDHRFHVDLRLFGLKQRLHGGDAAGGAWATFGRHQTAPSQRAAPICTSAATAASAPLLCPSSDERSIACCSVCTVSN